MTFKDLKIGQKFRMNYKTKSSERKVELERCPNFSENTIEFNAHDDKGYWLIGEDVEVSEI